MRSLYQNHHWQNKGSIMRPFIESRKASGSNEVNIEIVQSYVECEYPIDENNAVVVYIIPRTENSVWVASSFEHAFDDLVINLDRDTYEAIADTWPILANLLENGIKERYQYGALIVMEDSDYCEKKWFVASIVGNISFETLEDLFGQRVQQAIELVISQSMTLWIEIAENKPNLFQQFSKGFLKGLTAAVTATVFAFLGLNSEQQD
ncbi:hypothetical protein [Calothrix sp. UHCC 0171]|uniref:hypothetical protein n=1 Tax=Calothrix sp. UHCC 0171 TaxID=3110245 RepID=UPI002B217A9E|nr:hypothetical protein [Calothrix sp. UHCC 0171]MEA5573485.1 hypothetical protein [Calothrix sp. UHCC 0171]